MLLAIDCAGHAQRQQQVSGRHIGKRYFVGAPEGDRVFVLQGVVEQGGGETVGQVGLMITTR